MNAKTKRQAQSIRLREEILTPPSGAHNLEQDMRYSIDKPLKLLKAYDRQLTKPHTGNQQTYSNLKIQNDLASYREELRNTGLAKYQEEIKESIEKMLKLNKLPQLDLKKTRKGEYIVSLEDLSFILATLIAKIDKKTEMILKFKRKNKSYKKKILDLRTMLKENTERVLTTRKKEIPETARSPKFDNSNGIGSFYNANQQTNDVLNDLQKLLKVKTQSELLQGLKKVTHVLKAIPEMEKFIKEVTSIVHQGTGSVKNPEGVISALKQWAKDRERPLTLKSRFYQIKQGEVRLM